MCSVQRSNGTVTVSMSYWGCAGTVRTAVESVLAQTYQDLRLVVINDGDTQEAWKPLDGIDDPRLTRLDLPQNHGRYYADAVVLEATDTPWFSIHDADDWCDPEWLAELVDAAVSTSSVAAFSPQILHRGTIRTVEPVHTQLATRNQLPELRQLAHHAGVYRTDALRVAGGYHPAYRIGYDTMVVNLVRMVGPCAVAAVPRYHRVWRFGSLTSSLATGFGSPVRNAVKRQLQDLYRTALATDRNALAAMVRATVPPDLVAAVGRDAVRLRTAAEAR